MLSKNFVLILIVLFCWPCFLQANTLSVPNDYATIQEAINGAGHNDTILVGPGVYGENLVVPGTGVSLNLISTHGPDVTRIDGGQTGSVIHIEDNAGVQQLIEGFTITNGKAPRGGGLYFDRTVQPSCELILRWNVFIDNEAYNEANAAQGGAVFITHYISLLCESNQFIHNKATAGIGGSGTLRNAYGPAITVQSNPGSTESAKFYNNMFYNNISYGLNVFSGAIFSYHADVEIINCTFCRNAANPVGLGGALFFGGNTNPTALVRNTIFWEDNATDEIYLQDTSGPLTLDIDYSTLTGMGAISVPFYATVIWGAHMSSLDPLLADMNNGDCRLSINSPCRDMGDNSSVPVGIVEDFEGDARINNSVVDIGADEWLDPTVIHLKDFSARGHRKFVGVTWKTASEILTAGFHVWRCERIGVCPARWVRITKSLVPAKGGPTWGAFYSYRDFDAKVLTPYLYQLEDVDFSGNSTYHEAVMVKWPGQ